MPYISARTSSYRLSHSLWKDDPCPRDSKGVFTTGAKWEQLRVWGDRAKTKMIKKWSKNLNAEVWGLRLLIETRGKGLSSYPGVPQAFWTWTLLFSINKKHLPLGGGFWTVETQVHLVVKVTRSQRRMYSAPRGPVLFDRLTGQTWSQLFSASKERWMNRLSSRPIKSPLPDPPKSACLGQTRSYTPAEVDGADPGS